jgi:hypothetical protein
VDLHRPCEDCEDAEDWTRASMPYAGPYVRSEPSEGQRIVRAALGSAELVQVAMEVFGKVGLPHVGGTAIPAEVLEERARNLVSAYLAGWRMERRSPTDEDFANEEAIRS